MSEKRASGPVDITPVFLSQDTELLRKIEKAGEPDKNRSPADELKANVIAQELETMRGELDRALKPTAKELRAAGLVRAPYPRGPKLEKYCEENGLHDEDMVEDRRGSIWLRPV